MPLKVESSDEGNIQVHTEHGYPGVIDMRWADFSDLVQKAIREKEAEARSSKQRWNTSGETPEDWDGPAPGPINPETGQHTDYWVLPAEERAKGFIRPVRKSYIHTGMRPKFPTRELTPEEKGRHDGWGYVLYEEYPESMSPLSGRFWTEAQLGSGCGVLTSMSISLAETYARNPGYYSSTMCVHCRDHFPIGEFTWEDGTEVGT